MTNDQKHINHKNPALAKSLKPKQLNHCEIRWELPLNLGTAPLTAFHTHSKQRGAREASGASQIKGQSIFLKMPIWKPSLRVQWLLD